MIAEHTRRAAMLWFPILLLLAAGSCAPIAEQMRSRIGELRFEEAIERGEKWLGKNGEEEDKAAETRTVRVLVAKARLGIAKRVDTVDAYRQFRGAHELFPIYASLCREALQYEAGAWYRDVTCPSSTVAAHQEYRRLYPSGPYHSESRHDELRLAFARAVEVNTHAAFRAFGDSYQLWGEAREVLREALKLEARCWFSTVTLPAETVEAHQLYQSRYPEGESVSESRVREVSVDRGLKRDQFSR